MSKAILFLQEFIKSNNKLKEDEAQTSKEKVASNPEKCPKANKGDVKRESERIKKQDETKLKLKTPEIKKKPICFAYKFDKCPNKEEDCENSHPKKCQKFSNFGHFAIDDKGCETQKCELFHPKLCRNSTKSKECPFRQCRFQHLKETKVISMKEYQNAKSASGKNLFEDKQLKALVNKFDKVMELMLKIVTNQEEGKNRNL